MRWDQVSWTGRETREVKVLGNSRNLLRYEGRVWRIYLTSKKLGTLKNYCVVDVRISNGGNIDLLKVYKCGIREAGEIYLISKSNIVR